MTPRKHALLVVDDRPDWTQFVKLVLGTERYEFTEARDGLEALAKLEGRDINVVITDTNMPRMDGLELLVNLRKGRPSLKVIVFFSGHADPSVKDALFVSLGASSVLSKDDAIEKLSKAVEALTSLH